MRARAVLRWLLAMFLIAAGLNHFLNPAPYLGMMPAVLPAPLALVYVSGVAEILCGAGLLVARTQRLAAWSTIALLLAVFPANINMAINDLPLGTTAVPAWVLWARLPLQGVLIAWAYGYTRPAPARAR